MERIGKIISVLSNQVHKLNNKAFKELNISHSEAITLLRINDNKDISLESLSKLMYVDKSATTRLVTILVNKKYVSKDLSSDDKRKYCLNLTSKGKNLLPKIQTVLDNTAKTLLTGINKKEEKEFRELVNKMILNARGEQDER